MKFKQKRNKHQNFIYKQMEILPCAGFIIFNPSLDQIVLVKTKDNNYSFPKGKRKKGETMEETALRELEEETGIKKSQITYDPNSFVIELSRNGNPAIKLFVGRFNDDQHIFKFDKTELEEVNWFKINEATSLLEIKRNKVLSQALELIKN